MRSYAAQALSFPQQTTSRVPASRSPLAITVAKPPSASTARISPATSRCAGSRESAIGAVAGEARERDVRAHEGACAAPDLVAFAVDEVRFGDEHSPPPADPAPLGDDLAAADRLGEVQVEGGGQQEAVGDQRVGRIERRIVEHL